jgi:hypothetical protein
MNLPLRALVHGGRLQLDEAVDWPDGTVVEIAAPAPESLPAHEERRLMAALAAAQDEEDRGEIVDAEAVIAQLRARG